MNRDVTDEFEGAIRAELRSQAQQAPGSAATKLAVLAATEGLPMDEPGGGLRRWTVPLLAAAVVLMVAVGLTVSVRALDGHHGNRPANQPSPSAPKLPAPKPVDVSCSTARGETLVDGAQTSFTLSSNGERRYVFDYYCAGSDGHRGGSQLRVYRMVDGKLAFDKPVGTGPGDFVLSLTGRTDGFQARVADESPSTEPLVSGAISTVIYDVVHDGIGVTGEGVQACRAADLTVTLANASQPIPHLVLQLTNLTNTICALWGVPTYQPVDAAGQPTEQPVRNLLRGPAGGVNLAASAPVIELRPGQTAGAAIGTDATTGSSCPSTGDVKVSLLNGLGLGTVRFGTCNIVGYPLVPLASGDDAADYPTSPVPTSSPSSPAASSPGSSQPNRCIDRNDLVISRHPVATGSGDGAGAVLTIKLLGARPCTITGYPVVRLVDSSGALLQLPAETPRGTLGGLAAATTSPPSITLTTGQSASVLVEWAAAAYTPTSHCVRNGRIGLTFGATTSTFGPAIGQLCDATVHPWVAGSTGSQ
ncbi:MAG: DUF4232 domain-containing protein [Jatrophihabitantaceae bacterium]